VTGFFAVSRLAIRILFPALLLVFAGCATVDQQYAGFRVIDKQEERRTDRVAIRIMACVNPRNEIICERRFGGPPLDRCNLSCRTPPNKWLEQPVGHGGYEDRETVRYFLVLQSPTGTTQRVETIQQEFNAATVGQVLGQPGQTPTAPASPTRRAAEESARPATAVPPATIPPAPVTGAPTGTPTSPQAAPQAINMAEAQRRLARLGFDPGPADGIAGSRTAAALRAFQRSIGLEVTGQLNESTRAELAKR